MVWSSSLSIKTGWCQKISIYLTPLTINFRQNYMLQKMFCICISSLTKKSADNIFYFMSQSCVIIAIFISTSLHVTKKKLFLLSRVKNTEISCLYVTIMCNYCKFDFHFVTHYNKIAILPRVKNTEISCLYVTIMCNYCKVSDDSPPSRAISHDQVNQDLVNDIGRPILSNLLMRLVSLTGLNII